MPEDASRGPGLFEFTIPGLPGENDARYCIQLPPEYDPLRRYPVIVALADAGVPPQEEIKFWAGPPRPEGEPLGQATRHGYITIAVDWLQPKQASYGYSAREHHAVLGSLRDACRRFSIDTDRVFLTGHGVGGDAAWDVALAHPDIWAGVMPFVATADRYCLRYGDNAEYMSVVLRLRRTRRRQDGPQRPRARPLLRPQQGQHRGRIFWAAATSRLATNCNGCSTGWAAARASFPRSLNASRCGRGTISSGGSRCGDLPERVDGRARHLAAAAIGAAIPRASASSASNNKLSANSRKRAKSTVWLGPEFVDFKKPITVDLKGRRMTAPGVEIKPQMSVLLEDARTRAERQHPFWAKVESGGDKRGAIRRSLSELRHEPLPERRLAHFRAPASKHVAVRRRRRRREERPLETWWNHQRMKPFVTLMNK